MNVFNSHLSGVVHYILMPINLKQVKAHLYFKETIDSQIDIIPNFIRT